MLRCRTFLTAAAAALLLAAAPQQRAAAQQPSVPTALPQDPLRVATEVGRFLFAYDEAASRATTMLLSEEVPTDAVEASIARQREGGGWSVGFGRLADEGGGFELMHEVVMNPQRLVDEVRTGVDRRLPPEHYYARAARAQQLVRSSLDGEHGPYNLLVVPVGSGDGHLTVYALPAQTQQDAYRLGGDHRFEVDPAAGEVASRTPLHEGYYEVSTLAPETAASAHAATRPVETDVLFATVRRPKAPHFVKTAQQVYRIAPDGAITTVSRASFEQRNDVRMLEGK